MFQRVLVVAMVSTLALGAPALAQQEAPLGEIRGTVEHIDQATGTIHLTDGQVIHVEPGTTIRVDGETVTLGALQRGAAVVVSQQPTPPAAPGALATHPPVDATGTIARVDPQTRTIVFQDGRRFQATNRTSVWQPSALDAVQPGAQVFLQDAQPTGFQAAAGQPAVTGDYRMGTVAHVDEDQAIVRLRDGTNVRVSPGVRLHSEGRVVAMRDLQPGDEVMIRLKPAPAAAPGVAERVEDAPAALPGTALHEVTVGADDVQVFRRPQAP